jgi:hypothetical protein
MEINAEHERQLATDGNQMHTDKTNQLNTIKNEFICVNLIFICG